MEIKGSSKHELCKRLWLENEPKIRRLCEYKLSSHPDEAEDIIAETALILWTAIFEDTPIKYPNSWIYAVAGNLIKKKYTELKISKERKIPLDDKDPEMHELAVGYDYDSRLVPDDLIERFSVHAEPLLKDDEKQLYQYVYEDKLKMKEIAVLMSSTESAVKQRNYRLTRTLKRLIKEFLENL